MVKTLEELLAAVKELSGEEMTDAAIALLEDISDTFNAKPEENPEASEWKAKAEAAEAEAARIDKEWREKYTARFFNGPADEEPVEEPEEEEIKIKTFSELFEEEKEEE